MLCTLSNLSCVSRHRIPLLGLSGDTGEGQSVWNVGFNWSKVSFEAIQAAECGSATLLDGAFKLLGEGFCQDPLCQCDSGL